MSDETDRNDAGTSARDSDMRIRRPDRIVHSGYWLWRVLRSGAPNRRSALGRRWEQRRLAYAVARGYPSWEAAPMPLQAAIDNALRQEFFASALFSKFWTEGPDGVPQRYLTAAEALRRQLLDIGLDPKTVERAPSLDAIRARYKPIEGTAK